MNEYEKEIFQWLEDAGLNPVHHNMAVPHLEVSTVYSLQSVFVLLHTPPPPLLAFRIDDEKKGSHYHHNANERFGFNLFLLAIISSFDKKC